MEDREIYLELMTWPEIKDRLTRTDIAIIPTGQTEQHGRHLPIDTDNVIARGIARRVAEATYESACPVVGPLIPFGYSDLPYFTQYPGTFTIQPETLTGLYYDVARNLIDMGFRKILFVNGHSPNPPFIQEAMRRLAKETGALLFLSHILHLAQPETAAIHRELGLPPDWGHACLMETSIAEVFGSQIREDEVKGHVTEAMDPGMERYYPAPPPGITFSQFQTPLVMKHIWPEGSPGPKGSPEQHSREIGERIIKAVTAPLAELVNDMKRMVL